MSDDDDLYTFSNNQAQDFGPQGAYGGPTTSAAPQTARPMTAVRGAGYTSHGKSRAGSAKSRPGSGHAAPPLDGEEEDTPEARSRAMEKDINELLETSARLKLEGNVSKALEKARTAVKRERALDKMRKQAGLEPNTSLTLYVYLNVAAMFHANGMHKDAIATYNQIVKNKNHQTSGRLRVNMGNVYYEQEKYALAIKMYRMALDQVTGQNKETRFAIQRNLGNAFVRLGQYQDAIANYEEVMIGKADFRTGTNLILCYYALGDKQKMKEGFQKLLTVRWLGQTAEDNDDDDVDPNESIEGMPAHRNDNLKALMREREQMAAKYIVQAAKLIAPHIESSVAAGFDWCLECMQGTPYSEMTRDVEIAKALSFLKEKDYDTAISTLKAFEKRDKGALAVTAATNLSFLYFLERQYEASDKHASMALEADRYNARALVNKANCLFVSKDFEAARELYIEAVNVEADCTEALYNLGLVNKQLGALDQALQAFQKLNNVLPNTPEVVFHIASILEAKEDTPSAIEWYQLLISLVPHDPAVLARLGQAYNKENDKAQAFHCYQESFRYYPSSMETLAWLGASCVENKVYDQAIRYFERAALLQPQEVKWLLMVASCYRRMGSYQKAMDIYKDIHKAFPEDVECLRYLERICTDLGMADEAKEYGTLLRKMQSSRAQTPPEESRKQQRNVEPIRGQAPPTPAREEAKKLDTYDPSVPDDPKLRRVNAKQQEEDLFDNDNHLADLLPE